MNTFYQIVSKTSIDGPWVGFFVENSELYNTYDEAYKEAERLAIAYTQELFNTHYVVQYQKEDDGFKHQKQN